MNIFAIEGNKNDIDWYKSATSLDNYRTVKMILETAQLLCTGLNENGSRSPYKNFNPKHPSCLWTIESFYNWETLLFYGYALIEEYNKRFEKQHKCYYILKECEALSFAVRSNFLVKAPTPLKLAMPENFKYNDDIVGSYRRYYVTKPNMLYPENRIPDWFIADRKLPFKVKDKNGNIRLVSP